MLLVFGLWHAPAAYAQKGRGHASAPHVSAPRFNPPRFNPPHYSAPRVTHQAPRPPSMPKVTNQAARQPGHASTGGKMPAGSTAKLTAPKTNTSRKVAAGHAPNAGSLQPRVAATSTSPGRVRRNTGYYRTGYNRRGYGSTTSQLDRMVVNRLRSEYISLARLPQNYQGHRARSMQHISSAIRQLSHRSMMYQGSGVSPQLAAGGANAGNAGLAQMSRAQSDARVQRSLRNLQGVGQSLSQQSMMGITTNRTRAFGYVQMAANELNVALTTR